jgi:hypothetical protein
MCCTYIRTNQHIRMACGSFRVRHVLICGFCSHASSCKVHAWLLDRQGWCGMHCEWGACQDACECGALQTPEVCCCAAAASKQVDSTIKTALLVPQACLMLDAHCTQQAGVRLLHSCPHSMSCGGSLVSILDSLRRFLQSLCGPKAQRLGVLMYLLAYIPHPLTQWPQGRAHCRWFVVSWGRH